MKLFNFKFLLTALGLFSFFGSAKQAKANIMDNTQTSSVNGTTNTNANRDTAVFGMGCFWCTEAIFDQLEGVDTVISGYSGGTIKNPTYKEVCTGNTGHAEVSEIIYDPKKISYAELLEAFWKAHDPTTLNRQGADAGTQYRSVVFYLNDEQKQLAEKYKKELDASGAFDRPIVTEIAPLTKFYVAENYHQNYYNSNGNAPYCSIVIAPKVDKFRKVFKDKVKAEK